MEPLVPDSYAQFLADLKGRIQAAQVRAFLTVSRELVLLYWQIGRDILERQERENWGAKVIDRLAADLKRAFPDMKGFSPRNLKYMRRFGRSGRRRNLCSRLLHNCPSSTTACFSTRLLTVTSASGTLGRPIAAPTLISASERLHYRAASISARASGKFAHLKGTSFASERSLSDPNRMQIAADN